MSAKNKMTPKQLDELTKDYDAALDQAMRAVVRLLSQMEHHRERYLREAAQGTRRFGMGDMHVVRNECEQLCKRLREGIDK